MRLDTQWLFNRAVESAQSAAVAYYDSSRLEMDDDTYDRLLAAIATAVANNPQWSDGGVLSSVAAGMSAGGDVQHAAPMLSLDNVFSPGELEEFTERLSKLCGEEPELVVEAKLDGLAISATYVNGMLTSAATRGDGSSGEDVTDRVSNVTGLPRKLAEQLSITVRGELVMTDLQFRTASDARVAAGKSAFANPRNATAGTLRAIHVTERAEMTFAAYGTVERISDRHSADMAQLATLGFVTAATLVPLKSPQGGQDAAAVIADLGERRASLGVAIDGAVIKCDLHTAADTAGNTSRAPRWAIAYKYPADTRLSTLVGIDISVGRTGALSYTAVLEPVAVGGVTVNRATLHNPSEIARKDVRIGEGVWVRRAGDVIPEVTGPNIIDADTRPTAWEPPTTCPRCAGALDTSGPIWRCKRGKACGVAEAISYAAGRDCLDIEGLGATVINALVAAGSLSDLADLYDLSQTDLTSLERVGEKSAGNILSEIEASKSQPFRKVLAALGVRHTGRRASAKLASHFGSMAALQAAGVEEISAVDGMGPIKAVSVVNDLAELSGVISRMATAGVNMVQETPVTSTRPQPWAGKTVCISGKVGSLSRDEAREGAEALGANSVSSVTVRTNILVAGPGAGSKLARATELGVVVVSPEEFLGLLHADS